MIEEYIYKLRPYVLDMFSKDSSGHDINHLERTMKLALYIQKKEGGDKICYAIEYHELYNWNGNNVEDINALILQDADNLDAIRSNWNRKNF